MKKKLRKNWRNQEETVETIVSNQGAEDVNTVSLPNFWSGFSEFVQSVPMGFTAGNGDISEASAQELISLYLAYQLNRIAILLDKESGLDWDLGRKEEA